MSNKLFDLHFEIGTSINGGFYARSILGGPNGVRFDAVAGTPSEALAKVALDMESGGMWGHVAKNPQIATYPFNMAPVQTPVVDPNAPRQRPSEIHNVKHPQCTAMCQAFDNFGDAKCKSICAHRKGL